MSIERGRVSEVAMSRFGAARAAAGVAVVLALASCSGPPWTLDKSRDDIALRWYPDTTPAAAAAGVAELHCRSWGKYAELASDAQDGSAEIARYRCR
jgi:hypothetical protein